MAYTALSLLALTTLASTLATPHLEERAYTPGEHLVLGDCGIDGSGNSKSRYMFYYNNAHWDWSVDSTPFFPPTSRSEVPWDGSYPWRPSGVSAKFANGDTFLVSIHNPGGKDNMLANVGTASHIYDPHPFQCYAWHQGGLATLSDGSACSSAYICYHDDDATPIPPTAAPSPTPTFKYTAFKENIELEGKWRAGDIFKWTQFIGNDYCDKERYMDLPNSSLRGTQCTLNVECGPNRARGMVRAIAKVLDQSEDFLRTYTKEIKPNCEDMRKVCMSPTSCIEQCMKWGPSEKVVTEVSRRGMGDLVGGDESWRSHVEYKINCPGVDAYDRCDACNTVGGLLSSIAGLLSGPLGFAGELITTGVCGSGDC